MKLLSSNSLFVLSKKFISLIKLLSWNSLSVPSKDSLHVPVKLLAPGRCFLQKGHVASPRSQSSFWYFAWHLQCFLKVLR